MSNLHIVLKENLDIIDHSKGLVGDIGSLFLQDDLSDITLLVEDERFQAHRVVLASRSNYFRALLYGGMKESREDEIRMTDASVAAFKMLLNYMYTGTMSLGTIEIDMVLDILGLSHRYGVQELQDAICKYLIGNLNPSNVCDIYEMATMFSIANLTDVCNEYMDSKASEIMIQDSFLSLSPGNLRSILKRDSFCAPEIQIFEAVQKWMEQNPTIPQKDLQSVLAQVRLPLINLLELVNIVRPTKLISAEAILEAIKGKLEATYATVRYRGYMMPGENMALYSKDAVLLNGEPRNTLLVGTNITRYDMDRGFTRHVIDDLNDHGILIQLGKHCFLNHIKMLLWDKDSRSYSYYIEVSMDMKEWFRVVDHSKYYCRSWQFLHFPEIVVKYIRIVGTHNTVNRLFHLVAFEAYYVTDSVQTVNGFIAPKENVALVSKSAVVMEGVSRALNSILSGNIHHYDWDSGYTCHQLGSGSICIRLGQPYMLSSCKLLLWDCDNRKYAYYIETSVNGQDWEMVADKRDESCSSWQVITFTERLIVYFRIVGTYNSVNEVFHLVHFEAPAQENNEALNLVQDEAQDLVQDEPQDLIQDEPQDLRAP